MKIKKHNMSNPNLDKAFGDYIKKTIFQFYHSSISVDDFIDKCDRLSMQSNSLQVKQTIKIQRTHYINLLKKNGQECFTKDSLPTSQNEISEKTNVTKFAHKRKIKHYKRQETLEERHKRNGDKNVEFGYSSTGVPLPTTDQMKAHKKRKPFARFIQVPMGGKSNRY